MDAPHFPTGFLIFLFVIFLFLIATNWKIYTKAGRPGWESIVPIYNTYIFLKIVGRPGWWLLLLCIPIVNFIFLIIITNDLAKAFGKGIGFTLGLIFLGFIFFPILAFGDSKYQGPEGGVPTMEGVLDAGH